MATVLQNSHQSWTVVFKDSKKVYCREISKSPVIGCFYEPEAFSQCRNTHPLIYSDLHKTEVAVKFLKKQTNKKNFETVWKMDLKVVFFVATPEANLHMPTKKLYTVVYSEILPLHYFEMGLLFYRRFHHANF